MDIKDAHFECVSMLVPNAVRGLSRPQVSISNIISSICHRLQAFHSMQVSHAKREDNKLAHILNWNVKGIDNYESWVDENMGIIESALAQNVLNLSLS